MKARVATILSKENFTDGQRRLGLRFKHKDIHTEIIIPEAALGIVGLALDDELEVSFHPVREQAKSEAA